MNIVSGQKQFNDLKYVENLSKSFDEKETIAFHSRTNWYQMARKEQLDPNGDWSIWLVLAGRGWGKTRTGAESIITYAIKNPNTICGVIAPTSGDLRRVCFEGPSGLLKNLPRECYLDSESKSYNRSAMEIKLWNGSVIQGYAAIEPDRLRGPQFHRIWADELAAWRYPEAYDQMMFGLRLGTNPKLVITTTPRPSKLIKDLVKRNGDDVVLIKGSTFDNAENLAESSLKLLKEKYENTSLGRQELYAEIIEEVEGALWTMHLIDRSRKEKKDIPDFKRLVIAIDPAVTSKQTSDETGIIVVGKGQDNRYYVLEDSSGRFSADAWARKAVDLFYEYSADRIVAETNNGGDLVERLIRSIDNQVPYKAVHATRGKIVRAEPISALYEQNKVHHIGSFPVLEDQMISYTGSFQTSPDRLDALVWGLSELSKSSGNINWRVS
jgi:predicted phage terminase large subunit-like protein